MDHPVPRRRALLGAAAMAAAAGPAAAPRRAAGADGPGEFPRQPIRIIVPFATGSGSDTVARLLAAGMKDALGGHPVVVENRSGGGGITGTAEGARAPADGHTVTMGTTSSLAANPALNPRAGYEVERDFAAVAGIARAYYAIVTANRPDAPQSLAELVARLKRDGATYASAGVGTITHLCSALFLRQAGAEATHVPYRGSGGALTDIAAGRVLFGSDTMAATIPLIAGGQLRALAVTAPQRLASLPAIPTTAEAGFPELVVDAWFGIAVPAATPAGAIATLSEAAIRGTGTAEMRARFAALELETLAMPPAPFGALMRETARFWGAFIRQAGITLSD